MLCFELYYPVYPGSWFTSEGLCEDLWSSEMYLKLFYVLGASVLWLAYNYSNLMSCEIIKQFVNSYSCRSPEVTGVLLQWTSEKW